jgi:hypothetical protein
MNVTTCSFRKWKTPFASDLSRWASGRGDPPLNRRRLEGWTDHRLLYVAPFAVAFPLWDYLVFWPVFHRQSQADPARARTRLARAIGSRWGDRGGESVDWLTALGGP